MKGSLSEKAGQMLMNEIHKPCPIIILSVLYYFKPQIHEKSEKNKFQWKWVYGIGKSNGIEWNP